MRIVGLASAALLLVLAVFCNTAVYTVVVDTESAIYHSDAEIPLSQRSIVGVLPPGSRVEVLKCIDSKSDQYFQVLSPSNEIGYLYNLNVVASISLSRSSRLSAKDVLGCSLFLIDKFS